MSDLFVFRRFLMLYDKVVLYYQRYLWSTLVRKTCLQCMLQNLKLKPRFIQFINDIIIAPAWRYRIQQLNFNYLKQRNVNKDTYMMANFLDCSYSSPCTLYGIGFKFLDPNISMLEKIFYKRFSYNLFVAQVVVFSYSSFQNNKKIPKQPISFEFKEQRLIWQLCT